MKVLAVIDGTGIGGAENSLAALALPLVDRGVELEVAYFHDRVGIQQQLIAAGVPLVHVPLTRSRVGAIWRLHREIRRRRPDLVHTMVFEADIIGRSAACLARVPVVSSIISEMYGPEQFSVAPNRLRLRLAWLADAVTARCVRRFHAVTSAVADVMAPRLHVPRDRVRVVFRGRSSALLVRPDPARRAAIRRSLGINGDSPLVLSVARHEPAKDLAALVAAVPAILRRRPDARIVVAGRFGSSTQSLETLIRELGVGSSVDLLGHRDDVGDLIGAADVVVCTSRWEGIGGSLLEAMAVGCPIVSSDLPVLREVTRRDDGAGHHARFFPPGDAVQLACMVDRSLDDADLAAIDQRQDHFRRHFSLERIADQMTQFYEDSIAGR